MENCKCDCFQKVPEETRKLIYDGYQNLCSNNEKFLYLYGLIYKTVDKNEPSRSRSSFKYHVRVNGFHINICQKAFMNIHGITKAKIRTLTQKLNDGVMFPQDMRCENIKYKKRKLGDQLRSQVKNHIFSILEEESVSIFASISSCLIISRIILKEGNLPCCRLSKT